MSLNDLKQHFTSDKCQTFLPVTVVVILWINAIEQNIDVKVIERLHQNQWQFSCHQIWFKVASILTVNS